MVESGEIELACLRCGQTTVFHFSELEGDVPCAGCAQSMAIDPKQLHRAIARRQSALNAAIRGLKRRPR